MPETKINLKNLDSIRLMTLDTSSLFLPFGRPVADYLKGVGGNQNGSRTLLKPRAIDFSPAIRWSDSTASCVRTTGFGELEREGLVYSSAAPAEPADPGVADFLPFERPDVVSRDSNQAKIAPAVEPEDLPVSLPRVSSLPLRPRMTFGPPPAANAKLAAPAPGAKPAAAPPAAKAAPPSVAPKPGPVAVPKPTAPAAPPKAPAAPAVQAKPVTVIPPAPRAGAIPISAPKPAAAQSTPKANIPARPAARTAELAPAPANASSTQKPAVVARSTASVPAQTKPAQTPARPPVPPARTQESAVSTLEPAAPGKPAPAAQPVSKAPANPPSSPKPPATSLPSGRSQSTASTVESAPAARKPEAAAPKPAPGTDAAPLPSIEPHLTMGADAESRSFLEKFPLPAKIAIALLVIIGAIYFVFAKADKPAANNQGVAVGEQGWSTEWASDSVGSRRGRQITLYRPSTGMTDYQMQFTGQIESKALGWVFRASDTKNYYAMKIESLQPGAMALTHFAVVDGRESSYAQRPLSVDARPGAAYRVKLDVTGPRFTVYIGGEPVDFWTDNRLKAGAVGFMNERDERGATSSVQFSFPHGMK